MQRRSAVGQPSDRLAKDAEGNGHGSSKGFEVKAASRLERSHHGTGNLEYEFVCSDEETEKKAGHEDERGADRTESFAQNPTPLGRYKAGFKAWNRTHVRGEGKDPGVMQCTKTHRRDQPADGSDHRVGDRVAADD